MAPFVVDIADSSDIVATYGIARARQTLLRLADILGETKLGGAVRAWFGDNDICATGPETSMEVRLPAGEGGAAMLGGGPGRLVAGAGGRVPREDRGDVDGIVAAAFEALKTTIRLGGSGNGLAH